MNDKVICVTASIKVGNTIWINENSQKNRLGIMVIEVVVYWSVDKTVYYNDSRSNPADM